MALIVTTLTTLPEKWGNPHYVPLGECTSRYLGLSKWARINQITLSNVKNIESSL